MRHGVARHHRRLERATHEARRVARVVRARRLVSTPFVDRGGRWRVRRAARGLPARLSALCGVGLARGRPVPRLQAGRVPRRHGRALQQPLWQIGADKPCAAAATTTAAAAAAVAAAAALALAAAAAATAAAAAALAAAATAAAAAALAAAAAAVALATATLAFAATAALATATLALAATAALATSGLALAAALCVERWPRAPLRQGVSRRGGGLVQRVQWRRRLL